MRDCLASILAFSVALGVSTFLLAQTATAAQSGAPKGQAAASKGDLTGVWDRPVGGKDPDGTPAFAFTTEDIPMLPWAAEQYKAARSGPLRNPMDKGIDALDPSQSCFPTGPTRIFNVPRPFEIRQFPEQVMLLFEWDHWVRRIYTDGRGHPDGYPLQWMGHSTGKWEGDTLVADTVYIRDGTWIDGLGHPHTDALHIVERFRRPDPKTLEINFWFEDPKTYPKPWTGKKTFQLKPPGYEIMEHAVCEDWLEMGKTRQPHPAK